MWVHTDQLKRAKFFAISPIPVLGISINNGGYNDVDELYSVDKGYKVCNEHGGNIYYQSDFLSLLKSGHIIYCPDEIKHITCAEKISDGAILIHEFDSIEKRK